VKLPDDSDASPGVLHSSLMSASPADFMSAEVEAAGVDCDGVDCGSGGDGWDDAPGVTGPVDADLTLSCCLLQSR